MNLLTAENIVKSYGERILLNKISFGIGEGEKVGVIGINGTGKSTFLKILAGMEQADDGKITTMNGIKIEYLPQSPEFDDNATVLEQVFKGNSPIMALIKEYETALQMLNKNTQDTDLQKRVMSLSSRMDTSGAWSIESEAKNILTRLKIFDFDAVVGTLSGGQRKRIALASALINPADLLILDEPTNHIDSDTVEWLEEYLNRRKGALIMVTHDRYFLDRVANKIIEIHNGNLYSYSGNYSTFLQKKSEREEMQEASESKRQNLIRRELAWIKRGAKARSTKQKARIERFENLVADKADAKNGQVEISSVSSRLGKKVVDLNGVYKSFGNKKIINNFSYILLRDDRVGILGPNGSGKSTLMNILSNTISPDSGDIDIGETVNIGYYCQETKDIDENLRVIDYIKEGAELVQTSDGNVISASQMLERFLFPPHMQYSPISKLSGGERRRLYLLRILMGAPNVLLLDEPTNDLDIETLTILEDYLDDFNGAVITVSHDRYFLDKIVDKIFAFDGNGTITQHTGNYSDYQERLKLNQTMEVKENQKTEKKNVVEDNKKEKPLKFTFKEQLEFKEIDGVIEGVEAELKVVTDKINNAGSDFSLLQELLPLQQQLETRLDELIERWTYLNELAEKIEKSKQ